jgi:hypothetical protein
MVKQLHSEKPWKTLQTSEAFATCTGYQSWATGCATFVSTWRILGIKGEGFVRRSLLTKQVCPTRRCEERNSQVERSVDTKLDCNLIPVLKYDDEFTDIDDSVGVSNAVWVILILVCPHGQFLIKLTRRPRVYSRGQNQWTKNLIFPYRLLWIKVPSASWLKLKTNNP